VFGECAPTKNSFKNAAFVAPQAHARRRPTIGRSNMRLVRIRCVLLLAFLLPLVVLSLDCQRLLFTLVALLRADYLVSVKLTLKSTRSAQLVQHLPRAGAPCDGHWRGKRPDPTPENRLAKFTWLVVTRPSFAHRALIVVFGRHAPCAPDLRAPANAAAREPVGESVWSVLASVTINPFPLHQFVELMRGGSQTPRTSEDAIACIQDALGRIHRAGVG
jgi:hypothetical protein